MTVQVRGCLAFIVAGVVIVTAACSGRDEYIARGDKAFEAKDYQAALVEYRNAVGKDPNSVSARRKLARVLSELGSTEGARRELVRAADLAPGDNELQLEATEALMRTGEFTDAKTRAEAVISRDAKNVRAHVLRGLATAGMNDLETAVEDVQRALELDPRVASNFANLGVLQLARGRGDEAEAALKQAAALAPDDLSPQLALANYYWRVSRRAEAEQLLQAAIARHPNDSVANRALATFYIVNGRTADAEAPLKAAAQGDTAFEGKLALADYYVAQSRLKDATAILEPLSTRPEARAAARSRLAGIHYSDGRKAEAYAIIDGVLKEQPKNVQVLVVKGRWQLSEGQTDAALETARAAVAADPKSVQAHYLMGMVQSARRDFATASDAFTRVLDINPRAVPAQLQLAQVNLQRNDAGAAVLFASQALKNDPRNVNARLALVKGLRANRDLNRAQSEVTALLQAAPQSPSVHLEAGEVALAARRFADAERAFTDTLRLDPKNVDAVTGLVGVEIAQRRLDRAQKRIESSLSEQPGHPQLLLVAGRTYAIQGRLAEAEQALQKAVQAEPGYMAAYHILGQIYVGQGRLAEATTRYEEMARREPNSVAVQTMIAMLLQVQNRGPEAEKKYEQILQIDPRAAVAANNLAYMKAEAGTDLDIALQLAQTAKAVQPEDPDVNDTLGWVYYKKDLANLAIGPLKISVDRVPDNPIYRYHLGMAYVKTGDKRGAREMLQEALRLNERFDGANQARAALATLGS